MPFYNRLPSRLEARQWNNSNDTDALVEWTAGRAYYDPFGHNLLIEKEGGSLKRLNYGDYVIKLPNRTFDGLSKALFEADYKLEEHGEGPTSPVTTDTYASVDEMVAAVKEVSEAVDPVTDGEPNTVENTAEESPITLDETLPIEDDGKGAYTMKNSLFG